MTVTSRIRLNRSEPDRMNPGAALLLFGAIVAGFIKLILPASASGLRWEYLYLMVGAAAVLVLDTIRAAIADRDRPMAAPWTGSNVVSQQEFRSGKVRSEGQIGPLSSEKSEKSGGGTET